MSRLNAFLSLTLTALFVACAPGTPTTPSASSQPTASPSPQTSASPAQSSGPIRLIVDGKVTPVKAGLVMEDTAGPGMRYFFGNQNNDKGWSVKLTTHWNRAKETSQVDLQITETTSPANCPTCTAYDVYEVTAAQFTAAGSAGRTLPAGGSSSVSVRDGKLTLSFKGTATRKFPTELSHQFELEATGLPTEAGQ